MINAQNVVSLMHLNIAVSRALVNRRDGKLKSNNMGTEVVYYCSPNHSINHTLESFGIKNCTTAFFALFVDLSDSQIAQIKSELVEIVGQPELEDLNKHLEWQDQDQIIKIFDLKEKEKELQMPNAHLTSLYNKIALKGI